jgi:ABC-type dipeptide/oligopeptide/nickel transport system permease component
VAAFIVRRVLWTIPVVLLIILFTFLLVRAIATGPFAPANYPRPVQTTFHLDQPCYEQYAFYVKSVFTLDFGPTLAFTDRTVNDIIINQYPNSLLLGLLALAWAVAIGIPAGMIAALRPGSVLDYMVMVLSSIGFAFPAFLVATLLIYYVALKLE